MSSIKQNIWGNERRFNDYPTYIRKNFSGRAQKVSVDAGFTCPNRDGTLGVGGCTYCNNQSFKPAYCNLDNSVTLQIEKGVGFFSKKHEDMRFLAYFQAYTSTHASLEKLIDLYEEALKHPGVIGLVISTRPDCLPNNLLDYLQAKSRTHYVMLELGVESCNNKTLEFINRGHTFEKSVEAIGKLAARGIHSCAHMILGLPGEDRDLVLQQAHEMSKLPVENLKLHQLQIHRGTIMEKQHLENPEMFNLYETVEDYIDLVIEYLENLNPRIVIERFISQSPRELLVAPRWGLKNFEFVEKLEKELALRNTWQGRLYG
jgi:radical SAM protein (TIGR01212 family)